MAGLAGEEREGIYAPLFDESFLRLWRMANEQLVTWDQFSALPMPEGASAQQAWAAIAMLRRWAGAELGSNESNSGHLWMNLPEAERRVADDILARGRDRRLLDVMGGGRYSVTYLSGQTAEVVAALEADGETVDYEVARGIIKAERRPVSLAEKTLAAYVRMLDEEASAAAPLARTAARMFDELLADAAPSKVPVWVDRRVLGNVERILARATIGDYTGIEVLGGAFYIWSAFKKFEVADRSNALLGSLLHRAFLIRCGYAPLGLLPMTGAHVELGVVGRTPVEAPEIDCKHDCHTSCPAEKAMPLDEGAARSRGQLEGFLDHTDEVSAYLRVMDGMLAKLERSVQTQHARIESLREEVLTCGSLSYRQRDILAQALSDPSTTFDYPCLIDKYQAAYSTIRIDVNGLVNRGLLFSTNEGRKLSFHPVPHLAGKVEELLGR